MAGATIIAGDERSDKVHDYLDDRLQTAADLESLDSLIQSVTDQQALLKQQLRDAEIALREARRASEDHERSILEKIQGFEAQQEDIDRRLLAITQSNDSDDAVERFEESIRKLQHLDIAARYVELLKEVDDLSTEARERVKTSPEEALKPYLRIRNISSALKALQPAAEGAAPHLIDHVEKACQNLWKDMRDTLSLEFERTLKRMNWPVTHSDLRDDLHDEWAAGVVKLLRLQEPELFTSSQEHKGESAPYRPPVLLPLEVMVRPLELRFQYHFEGDRPTNRLDKPEYFLSHLLDQVNQYAPFFATYLQPILRDHFRGQPLELQPAVTDSDAALITAVLSMLRRKVFNLLPQIAGQPQLLSHFIHEIIGFDTALRDQWEYNPSGGTTVWKGITWEILVEKNWFATWLQVEKDFALARYQDIIDAKDAGEIDYDSVEPGKTKPTKAAIRVNDLLESITDRYRPLASFSQKLRFLIDIQLAIFDKFHSRLMSGVDAYLAATSAVVRAVQGSIREDKANVEGINGLERLCRIHGSADYVVEAFEVWSDDIFFIELWDELQRRARSNSGKGNLAGPLTTEEVAERTSSAVGSDGDSGALFDETADAYRRLCSRTEEMIVELLNKTMRDALRPYSKINTWALLEPSTTSGAASSSASASASSASAEPNISPELEAVLQPLDACLAFLARALGRPALRRVGRQLARFVQAQLWDGVLLRHRFSAHGAAQFARDVATVWRVMDGRVGPAGHAALGMKRLRDALVLLNLPAAGSSTSAKSKGEAGSVDSADADGLHARSDTTTTMTMMSLHEAEDEIFADNDRARAALEKLGLRFLGESDARSVLERRVDVG